MDKKKTSPREEKKVVSQPDPNILLNDFLNAHGLTISVSALTNDNAFIEGKGFVLTDKPLLIISAQYKD